LRSVASSSIVSWIFSLITRPPQVDYELTPLGRTLLDAAQALLAWADAHLEEVDAARVAYDARALRVAELPWPPAPSPAP